MKKVVFPLVLIATLMVQHHPSFAQKKDSTKIHQGADSISRKTDSLNAKLLQQYQERIDEIEKLRIADSIKRAGLEKEINSLQTTDNLKKQELEQQLQELRNKEAQRFAERKEEIDSLRNTAKAFPVLGLFNDTLFLIYNRSGSFTAAERAEAVTARVHKLADVLRFTADSIAITNTESTTDLSFRDAVIISISDNDALWNNSTRQSLAENYRQIIANEILEYKKETSFKRLAREIALALLVIAIVFFIIKYTGRFFRWTRVKIRLQKDKLIKGIRIRNYTLFDSGKEVWFLIHVNNVLKWIVIVLVIYFALPILFGIFPWTKTFSDTLLSYILDPVKKIVRGFVDFLPNLITIIVILIFFRWAFKGIKFLKEEIKSGKLKIPGFYPDWAAPTYQIIRVLVFAFMIVVIYPYLPGSGSPVFQGVSVFLGFLFTFGSAGSLSNIISGLILTYMRLFKIGDRVKIGDVTGDVIEKSMLVTRIRTIKNEIISIPNSTVMNSHTINYSSEATDLGLIINTTVTIGYDVPWKKMHEALIEAALRTEFVLKKPTPFVLQTELQDFYVSYQINAYIHEANLQAQIYSELHQHIQDVCNENDIEIMSPHYRAERDGNTTTIPEQYWKKNARDRGANTKNENE